MLGILVSYCFYGCRAWFISNHIILCKLEQGGRAIEYLENLTKTESKTTSLSSIEKQILMRLS